MAVVRNCGLGGDGDTYLWVTKTLNEEMNCTIGTDLSLCHFLKVSKSSMKMTKSSSLPL
jgi:hypothetical protein